MQLFPTGGIPLSIPNIGDGYWMHRRWQKCRDGTLGEKSGRGVRRGQWALRGSFSATQWADTLTRIYRVTREYILLAIYNEVQQCCPAVLQFLLNLPLHKLNWADSGATESKPTWPWQGYHGGRRLGQWEWLPSSIFFPEKKDAFRDFASGSFSPIRAATEQTFNINEDIFVSNHVIENINVLLLAQVCI